MIDADNLDRIKRRIRRLAAEGKLRTVKAGGAARGDGGSVGISPDGGSAFIGDGGSNG